MIARGNFCIKNYPIQSSFEKHKQIFQSPSATQEIGTFRLDYEYEIEYEYDFRISNQ